MRRWRLLSGRFGVIEGWPLRGLAKSNPLTIEFLPFQQSISHAMFPPTHDNTLSKKNAFLMYPQLNPRDLERSTHWGRAKKTPPV